MPSLNFEGETHDELVRKVRRWLASVEGDDEPMTAVQAVERASEITKDALTVIASAAPGPIAAATSSRVSRRWATTRPTAPSER